MHFLWVVIPGVLLLSQRKRGPMFAHVPSSTPNHTKWYKKYIVFRSGWHTVGDKKAKLGNNPTLCCDINCVKKKTWLKMCTNKHNCSRSFTQKRTCSLKHQVFIWIDSSFFFSIKWYSYNHVDLIYFILFGIHMYLFKNCKIMRKAFIHITGKVALMVFKWFFFSSGNRVKIMTKIRWKVFHSNIMPKKLLEVYICIRKTDAN